MIKRIILTGKAASGKTHLAERLIEMGYIFPITYTTRPIRKEEEDGVHYNFVDESLFKEMIEDDKMYEWVVFNNWYYGRTTEDFYNGNLMIMTPAGISQMSEQDLNESYVIYLDINEDIRRERLSERQDADSMERRIVADDQDFKDFNLFQTRVTDPGFTTSSVQMLIDNVLKLNNTETTLK